MSPWLKAGSLQHCAAEKVTSRAAVGLGFAAALVDVILHERNHLLKLVLELGALRRGVGVQGGHDLQETRAGGRLRQRRWGCPPTSPAPPASPVEPESQPDLRQGEPTLPHTPRHPPAVLGHGRVPGQGVGDEGNATESHCIKLTAQS